MPKGSDQSDDLKEQSNSTGLIVHGSEVSDKTLIRVYNKK